MIRNFSEFLGNSENIKFLIDKIITKTIPNAFLFYGPEGIGKRNLSFVIAASLNCLNRSKDSAEPCGECVNCKRIFNNSFPDVTFITRDEDRTTISIEQVRNLKKEAYRTLYEGLYKIFIIDDTKELKDSANALLKLIEEPPDNTLFILLTSNLMKQLPTILSRCQVLKFQKLSRTEIESFLKTTDPKLLEDERIINFLAGGSPGEIIKLSSSYIKLIEESVINSIGYVRENSYYQILKETNKITSPTPKKLPFLREDKIEDDNIKENKATIKNSREFLLNWFLIMQMLLRDLVFFMKKYPDNLMFFKHLNNNEMDKLIKGTDLDKLLQLILKIEEFRSAVEKNANRELIFLNFVIEMKSIFT
ncbi:AAA family ATPase [Candidatus Dependentiae bacterium]|nr:AAA family ATPase [Candidatus Dependentiae bacterium]